jgi:DNA processing protein
VNHDPITDHERRDRLRLIRTRGVGPATWRELMAHFGTASDALAALPDMAGRAGRKGLQIASAEDAESELVRLDALGATLVTLGETAYPEALASLDHAPPVLSVIGDTGALHRTGIAIVGARNASANGRRLAETIASDLAADDSFAIVSGLARGVDTAAHEGALASGGATVAVMAGGLDIVYPPENTELYARIRETGAIVSEMPPGTEPKPQYFPRRNRIVSGLSHAVVVVEAARRSGSLITARLAGEQGREVLAVPGSPLDPRVWGANNLIREGATLVRDADDIREAVAPLLERAPGRPQRAETVAIAPLLDLSASDDESRDAVVACLSPEPVAVDEIVRRCQLTAPVVRTILLKLELAGRLERHPGNRVAAC